MKFNHSLLYALCVLLLMSLVACGPQKYTIQPNYSNRIYVGPGPEDIALDESISPTRILVACGERRGMQAFGGIFSVDPSTDRVQQLRIDTTLKMPFSPHGIDISEENGVHYLYVVNHYRSDRQTHLDKDEHAIIKFEIRGDFLKLEKVYKHPLISVPNDICVLEDGSFYFSNWVGKSKRSHMISSAIFKRKTGNITYYDAGSDRFIIAKDKLQMPNGIGVIGQRLFATLTTADQLRSYAIQNDGSLIDSESMAMIKAGDNITFDDQSRIITTSHTKASKFIKHSKSGEHISPSAVYAVHPLSKSESVLYVDNGENISGSSAAIIYDGYIYIAQVFEPFLLKVPYNK